MPEKILADVKRMLAENVALYDAARTAHDQRLLQALAEIMSELKSLRAETQHRLRVNSERLDLIEIEMTMIRLAEHRKNIPDKKNGGLA